MRELLPMIDRWRKEQKRVALATVVRIYGSAPLPLGAKMAISSAGEMAGSVSGGCVESAVAQEALACLVANQPKLLTYGIADELAQSVGLACGGTIEVFVAPLATNALPYQHFERAVRAGRLAALATVLNGATMGASLFVLPEGATAGTFGDGRLDDAVLARSPDFFTTLQSERLAVETIAGSADLFIDVQPPQPRLWIVGAVHIAAALVTYARPLGFRTIVIDPRAAFATPERFVHADELIARWPQEVLTAANLDAAACVVVLTHDAKIDNPALVAALHSPARYIGALGARKTHATRIAALNALGLDAAQLARIHAPIGLAIGARRPEEIALAIMAEIVAVVNGQEETARSHTT
jgi:xanthine dehydrogenase accessory factor